MKEKLTVGLIGAIAGVVIMSLVYDTFFMRPKTDAVIKAVRQAMPCPTHNQPVQMYSAKMVKGVYVRGKYE
ncbi:MAG: hypothetical protein E3K37_01490 [Candidatus Kuenenia sp.]|nr:hypothetical protein [Candidatus Kuenenia hertensis]